MKNSLNFLILFFLSSFIISCSHTNTTSTSAPTATAIIHSTTVLALGLADDGTVCSNPNCWDMKLSNELVSQFNNEIAIIKENLLPVIATVPNEVIWYVFLDGTRYDDEVTIIVRANLSPRFCTEEFLKDNSTDDTDYGDGNNCTKNYDKEGYLTIAFDQLGYPSISQSGIRDREN